MFKEDRFNFSEVDLTAEEQKEIIAEINNRCLNKQSDYVKLDGFSATIWQGRVTIHKDEPIYGCDYSYDYDFDDIEEDEPEDDRLFIDGVPTIKFWNKFWGEEE